MASKKRPARKMLESVVDPRDLPKLDAIDDHFEDVLDKHHPGAVLWDGEFLSGAGDDDWGEEW